MYFLYAFMLHYRLKFLCSFVVVEISTHIKESSQYILLHYRQLRCTNSNVTTYDKSI